MSKIKRLNTLKNVDCFPRLFNKAGKTNAEYFIDSNHSLSGFERLFNESNVIKTPEASIETGGNMSGVNFENDPSIKMTSTKEEGYTLYDISGTCSTMTEEQQKAWSPEAVAGETEFVIIGYATNFVNAYKRKTGWVDNIEDEISKVKDLPEDGYLTVILGINGPGVANVGKPYYKVEIINKEENILATYIFDVSKLYKEE